MKIRRRSLAELSALVLFIELLVCARPALGATTNVFMNNFSFTPSVVNIKVGDTVTWVNQAGSHTATGTGADPICGNGTIPVSQSVTFNTVGSFPYVCIPHAGLGMSGQVIVTAASAPPLVSITAPMNGTKVFSGTTFPFTFSTNGSASPVTKVDLYDGSGLVFTLTSPFTTNFPASGFGSHTAFAIATDNGGLTGTSAPVTLQILSTNVTLVIGTPLVSPSFTASNTAAGHTYAFDALTNFTGTLSTRWFPIATNTAPSNNFIFSDSVLTNQLPRLYRVRQSL